MTTTDSASAVRALRACTRGDVIAPGDAGYEDARRVWNGVIDRHPAVIARCTDTADVVEAVHIARRYGEPVSIRGGGHQIAGSGVCDDGLVIDVSAMRSVHVDPDARAARVAAGARWSDVDRATQLFGLATTGGEVGTTGVAGLTLGGGMGLLQRAYGLACDNVRSVEIVTADGVVRTASATEHPDSFATSR
jgi:FAD/FMN-containing dehydrogenase